MNTFYPLKGFEENYAINKLGQILNTKKNKLKTLTFDKTANIVKVSLSKNGGRKSFAVHTLIFNQFYQGEIPDRSYYIKHYDNDSKNCCIDNLYLSYSVRLKKEKVKKEKVKKEKIKKEKVKPDYSLKSKRGFEKQYNKKGHYTTNDELLYNIILSKGMGKRSRKLDEMLYKICEGVWTKLTKNLYVDFKQDMLNDALIKVYRNALKFDEKKYDNPIAYVTEICKRALALSWNTNYYKTDRYMILGKNKFISMSNIYGL